MKLRKNWKRFWTLNRHHAEGFTLVELIVVIAILAILGGVAIPAYSGYVKKANMQADMTLVSEIEHALTLAGYNGTFADGETAYIVLSSNSNTDGFSAGSNVENALIATFGAGYADVLKLKHDGWTLNSALLSAAANSAYADSVNNSSYVNNSTVPELLDNVQTVTQAAAGLLGTVTKTESDYLTALQGALGKDYMDKAVESQLIKKNEDGTYSLVSGTYDSETQKISGDLQTQLSNLMVLSVSNELDGMTSEEMLEIISSSEDYPYTGSASAAAQMAVQYAFFKAVDLNSADGSNHFDTLNSSLNTASGLDDVSDAFETYRISNSANISSYLYPDWDGVSENLGEMSDLVSTNLEALSAIMTGVNTVSPNYNNADTLKDDSLYTSGSVSNDVNGYLGAAAVAGYISLGDLPENGIIAFIIAEENGPGKISFYPDPRK